MQREQWIRGALGVSFFTLAFPLRHFPARYMKHLIFISIAFIAFSCSRKKDAYISSVYVMPLGKIQPEMKRDVIDSNTIRYEFAYTIESPIAQDDWHISIHPSFDATFHWQPHLTPTDNHIIAQHVFRAPAIIVADSSRQLAVLPDLSLLNNSDVKWYMDLDARTNEIKLGVSKSKVTSHVLFEREPGLTIPQGEFKFAFYVITTHDKKDLADPWRKPLVFMWKQYGEPLYEKDQPVYGSLDPYVEHTYNWAFNSWKKSVWQEFELNGKKVGAPVFIVNVTQSPNYPGEIREREFRSVWNQAWFSSLRSAEGLYRYARRTNNQELLRKANMTKELALSFPQKDGLFPSVVATKMNDHKSLGWSTLYFGNSNRNPQDPWGEAVNAPYHILDMSWTAYLMLVWNEELEKDQRLVDYAKRYADKLITLQDQDGFFPGWIGVAVMNQTPETSMSATFLLKLYQTTKEKKYLASATRAIDAVIKNIVPQSRWEDFETYWSCSRVLDSLVGKKVERNDAYKQNTLSMFWTADALLNFYKATRDSSYLKTGQRVLDQMLMYQQTWQPPYIPVPVLGGFGVMNADGEWNDSRQCLFAETIVRYGRELKNEEYIHRGLSALRAAFVMMYCPENPQTKAQWEKVYPFFNEKDYGFMMENYGHGGENNAEGLGIGEFTIYDWGNGAAAESYNTMRDRHPELF
jgi:rhamnogalacturonyl hydrolase YesR